MPAVYDKHGIRRDEQMVKDGRKLEIDRLEGFGVGVPFPEADLQPSDRVLEGRWVDDSRGDF
eukprot:8098934-Alexandrium_andersonii.AAC.1